jgi:hypothetical protein
MNKVYQPSDITCLASGLTLSIRETIDGKPVCLSKECEDTESSSTDGAQIAGGPAYFCKHVQDYIAHAHDAGAVHILANVCVPLLLNNEVQIYASFMLEQARHGGLAAFLLLNDDPPEKLGTIYEGSGRLAIRKLLIAWLDFWWVSFKESAQGCKSNRHGVNEQTLVMQDMRYFDAHPGLAAARWGYAHIWSFLKTGNCACCCYVRPLPCPPAGKLKGIDASALTPKPIRYDKTNSEYRDHASRQQGYRRSK